MSPAQYGASHKAWAMDPDKIGTIHVAAVCKGETVGLCLRCDWPMPTYGWRTLSNRETSLFEHCQPAGPVAIWNLFLTTANSTQAAAA